MVRTLCAQVDNKFVAQQNALQQLQQQNAALEAAAEASRAAGEPVCPHPATPGQERTRDGGRNSVQGPLGDDEVWTSFVKHGDIF